VHLEKPCNLLFLFKPFPVNQEVMLVIVSTIIVALPWKQLCVDDPVLITQDIFRFDDMCVVIVEQSVLSQLAPCL